MPFTEGVVNYPSSIDTDSSLFKAVDRGETYLTTALSATGMTVYVASTATFPDLGYLSIDDEIMFYTSKTATQFNVILRGAQLTAPASHLINIMIYHNVVAVHHNVLKDAIIAIENTLGVGVAGSYSTLAERLDNINIVPQLVYVPEYECMVTAY